MSSVPQGTVLGQILFLVLISDIDNNTTSRVASFADDTRVTGGYKNEQDTKLIQQDLETIYKWQTENNMLFNESKFELMRYGKDTTIMAQTNNTGPGAQGIEAKSSVQDLGVVLSDNMYFGNHINQLRHSVRKHCGVIFRTFHNRDPALMKTLWTSIIQPRIDYCCQMWFPSKASDIQQLETLLRNFTSRIPTIAKLNPWERLKVLKVTSLERRYERYIAIYIWKIIEGLIPNVGIIQSHSERRGRHCILPKLNTSTPASIQTIRESSLQLKSATHQKTPSYTHTKRQKPRQKKL